VLLTIIILTSSASTILFPAEQEVAAKTSTVYNKTKTTPTTTILTISTDQNFYSTGSHIKIYGQKFGGDISSQFIIIHVYKIKEALLGNPRFDFSNDITPEPVAIIPTITTNDGLYNVTTTVQDGGRYCVTASLANLPTNQSNSYVQGMGCQNLQKSDNLQPFTTFEAAEMFITVPFLFLYLSLAFFIALLTTIATSAPKDSQSTKTDDHSGYRPAANILLFKRDTARREILRFIFISGILASVIGSLVFSEVPIGANSPVGLVRQHTGSGNQTTTEWVINVGGVQNPSTLTYVGGIQIPATVVIFGLLGGYLRYLYGLRYVYTLKTSSQDSKDVDPLWGDIDLNDPLWFFKHALRSIAIIFLAPLLAVGIWFIVFQGQFGGKYAIAAISLAIGLITEEAVQAIIAFSRNILAGIKGVTPGAEKKKVLKVVAKSPTSDGPPVKADPPHVITATFDSVINMKTVDYLSFYLKDNSRNDPKDINEDSEKGYTVSDDGKTVMYTIPKTKLASSTTYVVTITTEVKDINGYSLDVPEIWPFMTEPTLLPEPTSNRTPI
jgi:hypothetical protein